MAKVKLPLMGVEARGQLAKSIVYFPWKGVKAVRTHIFPAQPRTAAQVGVRANFTEHVDAWHDPLMIGDDKDAWNRFAALMKKPQSGFNSFLGFYRKHWDPAENKSYDRNLKIESNAGGSIGISFWPSDVTVRNISVYYGYKKTYMPNKVDASQGATPGQWEATMPSLTVGAKLFFTIIEEVATYYGRAGIYQEVVAA